MESWYVLSGHSWMAPVLHSKPAGQGEQPFAPSWKLPGLHTHIVWFASDPAYSLPHCAGASTPPGQYQGSGSAAPKLMHEPYWVFE